MLQKHSQQTASDLEGMKTSMEELREQMEAAEAAIQDIATAAAKLEKERSEVCTHKGDVIYLENESDVCTRD